MKITKKVIASKTVNVTRNTTRTTIKVTKLELQRAFEAWAVAAGNQPIDFSKSANERAKENVKTLIEFLEKTAK